MINAEMIEAYVQRLMEDKNLTAEQRRDRTVRIRQFQQAFQELEASLLAPVSAETKKKDDHDDLVEASLALVSVGEDDVVTMQQAKQQRERNKNNKADAVTMQQAKQQREDKAEEKTMANDGDAKKEGDTIAKLKMEFRDAHLALMALFGYEYINRLPGYLYDGLPLNTMDKEEYQRRLIGADQELLSAAQVRDAEVERASTLSSDFEDKERIKRFAQKKYLDTVARINTGFHHFLHTITPIDAVAFNARRKELLDKKMAALRALRMLQIQGVEIGDLL